MKAFLLLILGAWLWAAPPAVAGDPPPLLDPTRPDLPSPAQEDDPAAGGAEGSTPTEETAPAWRISLIVTSSDSRPAYAILDGQRISAGDTVNGILVQEVTPSGVILEDQGERILMGRHSCIQLTRSATGRSRFTSLPECTSQEKGGSPANEIPLEKAGNGYMVVATLNDKVQVKFTLDTGATHVSIPGEVAGQLLSPEEYAALSSKPYLIADGSTVYKKEFVLDSVSAGGIRVEKVEASVAGLFAPPLLGMSFLGQLGDWRIDTKRNVLVVEKP